MSLNKVAHEGHKGVDAGFRHRVVDACPHTAHGPVPLERYHTGLFGLFQKNLVQSFIGQSKGYVHP